MAAIRSVAVTRKWSYWKPLGTRVRSISEAMVWKCALARIQSIRRPPVRSVKRWTVPSLRVATGWAARTTSCSDDTGLGCADTNLSVGALASPAAALIDWLGRAWLVIQT